MILLFVIVCALIILAFSAMMQPGRAKATAAARATGQQRPRKNRAQTADGRTAPPDQEGTTAGSPGQDPPRPNASRNSASNEGRPHAATNHATAPRRKAAAKLPTAKTESYTQPPRAETIHGSRALDGPKTTSPKPQNPPKSTDQPRISPQKPPDPVSISPFFVSIFQFFSIFSRFSAVSIPPPSRFFSIQPADLPKISRFFRPNSRFSPLFPSPRSSQISPILSNFPNPADFSRFLAPRPSCHFLHFVL